MFTEDLDRFLDTAYGLAITAMLSPSTPVAGFFDAAYLEDLGMAGTQPVFVCKASDVAVGDVNSKTLTISGVLYSITGRKPIDDGAFIQLTLRRS